MREAAVHLVGMLARPLIEAAIQQDALAIDFEQVLRTGGGAGGTAEFEFHVSVGFSERNLEKTSESRPLASNCWRRRCGRASTVAWM